MTLQDHAQTVERRAADIKRRRELAREFGNWIAYRLGSWDWFINPITFRDRHPDLERSPKTGKPRRYRAVNCIGRVKVCVDDPRLKAWQPSSKYRVDSGPPVQDQALAEIYDWLSELQEAAAQPIKTLIGEDFGRIGGRYHCHLLVGGVAHLRRSEWWEKAFERFGRTRILPFDPNKGAAFYCAKYAAKQIGALHFSGAFPGVDFSAVVSPGPRVGGVDLVPSAALVRDLYHLNLPRWHR